MMYRGMYCTEDSVYEIFRKDRRCWAVFKDGQPAGEFSSPSKASMELFKIFDGFKCFGIDRPERRAEA